MKTIEGMLSAKGLKLAIVVSRFNEIFTTKLLGGAEDAIRRTGGNTVAQASLKTGVPIAFGILTTENIQQTVERAGSKAGNKGFDAAMSAIEMANLFKKL